MSQEQMRKNSPFQILFLVQVNKLNNPVQLITPYSPLQMERLPNWLSFSLLLFHHTSAVNNRKFSIYFISSEVLRAKHDFNEPFLYRVYDPNKQHKNISFLCPQSGSSTLKRNVSSNLLAGRRGYLQSPKIQQKEPGTQTNMITIIRQ